MTIAQIEVGKQYKLQSTTSDNKFYDCKVLATRVLANKVKVKFELTENNIVVMEVDPYYLSEK